MTFVTDYVPIMLFPMLYIGAMFVMRVHFVKADDMDFVTNVAEFDDMTCVASSPSLFFFKCIHIDHAHRFDDPPPKNMLEALWMWLVRTCHRHLRVVRVLKHSPAP